MITTNIDVSDALANGSLGKLVDLQLDGNDKLSRIWIVFPHHRVNENWKKKIAGYVNHKNFDQNAVSLARRNANIPLDKK